MIITAILVILIMVRERLEKLSALRKIKPVDMTTLSQQVSIISINISIISMKETSVLNFKITSINKYQVMEL